MKRKRYTETQIIDILKEVELGVPVTDLCGKHGMSNVTFCTWRRRYAGMNVAEAKRLKQLDDENRRLKKLLADFSVDNHMLKELSPGASRNILESRRRFCDGVDNTHGLLSG